MRASAVPLLLVFVFRLFLQKPSDNLRALTRVVH